MKFGRNSTTKYIELIVASLNEDFTINLNLLEKYRVAVLNTFVSNPYPYAPQRTINLIKSHIDKINKITTNTTGIKLKKLAHIQR